jgi:hypothetical protein
MAAGAITDITHCNGVSGTGGIQMGIAPEIGGRPEWGLGFRPLLSAISDFGASERGETKKRKHISAELSFKKEIQTSS